VHGYGARDVVVFVELAAAVALVVTTALFVRFFAEVAQIAPRFAAAEILGAQVPAADAQRLADRVSGLPGVSLVSVASDVPGSARPETAAIASAAAGRTTRVAVIGVQPSFFRTVGITLRRGRSFDPSERAATGVAVVSTTAAERLWPGVDAIGRRLTLTRGAGPVSAIVIGVATDAIDGGGLTRTGLLPPDVYVPQDPGSGSDAWLLARVKGDPRLLLQPLGAVLVDGRGRRIQPRVLGDDTRVVRRDGLFVIQLLGSLGVVSLLLAASGIVGVVSQSVAQRTPEFGIRLALGASPRGLLRMVAARESRLLAAAIGTGLAGTVLVTRSAFAEMLAIAGGDARVWVAVAVLCGSTAMIALVVATWRVARLDPLAVLRQL
jgi:hypothetical protein